MSIPSLRQQMINEALDYHMNMNHVVFNRERKHVETMGQQVLDPTKSDIIIEGQIRDRISKIMTAIQKLVQSVSFDQQQAVQPQAGRGKPRKVGGMPRREAEVIRGEDVEEFDTDTDGESKASAPSLNTEALYRRERAERGREAANQWYYDRRELQNQMMMAENQSRRGSTMGNTNYPGMGASDYGDILFDDERGPGITTVIAPSSFKRQTTVYNAVSDILSNYNSLCDYLDLQNRQKTFTQRDISNIDGLVKQLIDPLKTAIGASSKIFETAQKTAEQWVEYTRIYNVIIAIISSIKSGYPFMKVDPALLTETIPLKEEFMRSAMYNPQGQGTQEYLQSLARKIADEQDRVMRLPQQTPTEIEARKILTDQLEQQKNKLKEAGLQGVGKPKKGGHVHKQERFDDQAELEPYLTKHLKPSKDRKDVPPIESSSEESSGDEGEESGMEINELRLGKGRKKGRKARKEVEDISMIMSMPVKEASALIAKKKRGGAKREVMKPIHKPAIKDSGADKDLWFL